MEVIDQPRLVSMPHALLADDRQVCFAEFLPRETLGAYIKRNALRVAAGPVYVHHNGYAVPDELWTRLIPRPGDIVTIRARMEGGGGGNKVLRTVALVAVAVASAGVGAMAASAYGAYAGVAAGTFSTGMAVAGAAAASAVMIGGSLLINALIPLPKPVAAKIAQQDTDAPSFSIGAATNRARPFEPMMLVFGRHKVYPDLAGNPHTFYYGDEQFLNQAFHFGLQQDLDISDIRIGDTPILNYQGVNIERSDFTGQLSMVPDNVDTLPGFELLYADGWNARTTPTDTYHIQIEVAASLFRVNQTTGAFEPKTVQFQIEYRSFPIGDWVPIGNYTDPVYATHYWALGIYSDANDDQNNRYWTQIRYGSLNAGDHVNGEQYQECFTSGGGDVGESTFCKTYEWRWLPHPYQLGRPWSGIAPDPLIGYTTTSGARLTGASANKPVRMTFSIDVGRNQYEIRVRKIDADISSSTESNQISVTQIRCYQDIPADYTGQSRLGIRVRASAQLNGSINQLSAMVQAHTYAFNGTAWEWRPTSNPAWWFLRFAEGQRDVFGNLVYGAGLPQSQVDYASIMAWGVWCEAQGLTFDYVLTQQKTSHEMLTMIARAGRASYTWQTGKLGVIWDASSQPHVGLVGPFNIRAGTFEVSYADSTVDEIVGTFVNRDRNWEADEVRVKVPGAAVLNNPLKFEIEGCTNASLAARETNLIAASQLFHRRRVVWEQDIEGMIATRGDVVQVTHDLTVWGYSGRLLGGTRNAGGLPATLRLDRAVPTTGAPAWMTLRIPTGYFQNIQVQGPAGESDVLTILTALPAYFPMPDDPPGSDGYTGAAAVDWAWQYDPLTTPGRRLKIVHVQPTNDEGVRFEAVDDSAAYYASEYNPYAYTPPRDGTLLNGIVFGTAGEETIVNASNDTISVRLSWVLSGAGRARLEYRINGGVYQSLETSERAASINANTGDVIDYTVTPLSVTGMSGTAKSGTYVVVGLLIPLPPVVGLTSVYRDGLTVLTWPSVSDIRNPEYEVRSGASWNNSTTIAITRNNELLALGNDRYFVAARFVTNRGVVIYGEADSIQISGATLVRNVLVAKDEHPTWTGTVSDGAFVFDGKLTLASTGDVLASEDVLPLEDVLWYGGVSGYGTYETNDVNVIDIGYPAPVRVDFDLDAYALNFAENVLGLSDVLAEADILNDSNQQFYKVQPQIRSAQVAGDWTDWADYVPGLINARFFDVRLVLMTSNPLIVPFVERFTWTIDVPDLIQRGEIVTVPSAGARFTYPKPFHATPNVQITWLDAVNGDRYVLTNQDATGFNIRFYNVSTPVSRQMNYISQGY